MIPDNVELLPVPAMYGILAFGAVLSLLKPYWGVLFGILLSVGMNARTLVFSRLPGMGAYFNMADACAIVCLAGAAADCLARRQRLTVPKVPLAIIVVLLLGFSNTTIVFGYSYEALRAVRWAASIPLFYIIAANVVTSERRAKLLVLVAFVGAVAAELQHVYSVSVMLDPSLNNEETLRTTAYMFAHSECWLVAGPLFIAGKMRKPFVQLGAASLFLVGNTLHQTRSVAIAAGCALLVYYGWFLSGSLVGKVRRLVVVAVAVALGLLVAIPTMGLGGFADSYSERMSRVSSGDSSTRSREVAVDAEFSDWMDGNILVGRGLGYYFAPEIGSERSGDDVAYAHVGYVTYLSQLGVVGLLVYGVWFPFSSIAMARRVRANPHLGPWSRHLAGLSGAVFLFCVFGFAMSGSFLTPDVLIGVLGGVVSSLSTRRTESQLTA